MAHLVKVIVGAIVLGFLLGLMTYALIDAMEESLARMTLSFMSRPRGGVMIFPAGLGAATGAIGMKILERFSGLAGVGVVFGLSSVSGAVASVIAYALCESNLTVISAESTLVVILSVVAMFVGVATWMANMDS